MASLEEKNKENELPEPWRRLHGAIWMLGLALIAWKGWWWPGILVLAAISGLIEFVIKSRITHKEQQVQAAVENAYLERTRAEWLPSLCTNCGGPLSIKSVIWTGPDSADCPYCSAKLKRET